MGDTPKTKREGGALIYSPEERKREGALDAQIRIVPRNDSWQPASDGVANKIMSGRR